MSKTTRTEKKPIEQYDHKGKERCNNPSVGLVTPETDREGAKKTYAYDPRTIIDAVRKRSGIGRQKSIFEFIEENPSLRKAIEIEQWRGISMISKEILNEAVRRLVEKFHPVKIILFGSQARETADNRSDVDLLIISPIKEKRRKLMIEMRRVLGELEYAFDVIILTREEYERDQKIPGTIGRYASREGKIIYELT